MRIPNCEVKAIVGWSLLSPTYIAHNYVAPTQSITLQVMGLEKKNLNKEKKKVVYDKFIGSEYSED